MFLHCFPCSQRWRRSCTSGQSHGRRENQTTVSRHANTYRTPLCQDSIWAVGGATAPGEKPGPEPGNRTPNHPMSEVNRMPFPLWHKRTKRPNCSLGRLTVHSGENVGQCGELAACWRVGVTKIPQWQNSLTAKRDCTASLTHPLQESLPSAPWMICYTLR